MYETVLIPLFARLSGVIQHYLSLEEDYTIETSTKDAA